MQTPIQRIFPRHLSGPDNSSNYRSGLDSSQALRYRNSRRPTISTTFPESAPQMYYSVWYRPTIQPPNTNSSLALNSSKHLKMRRRQYCHAP